MFRYISMDCNVHVNPSTASLISHLCDADLFSFLFPGYDKNLFCPIPTRASVVDCANSKVVVAVKFSDLLAGLWSQQDFQANIGKAETYFAWLAAPSGDRMVLQSFRNEERLPILYTQLECFRYHYNIVIV